MDPNPYESPKGVEGDTSRQWSIRRLLVVLFLLPVPIAGGVVGLICGMGFWVQIFKVPGNPALSPTPVGKVLVLLTGLAFFALSAVLAVGVGKSLLRQPTPVPNPPPEE